MSFQLLNITCHEARKISVLYSCRLQSIFAICSRFWDSFHVLCYVIPFHVVIWDGDSCKSQTSWLHNSLHSLLQKFIAIHIIKYASVVIEARQSPSWSLKNKITQPVFPRLVLILSLYCYLLLRFLKQIIYVHLILIFCYSSHSS